MCSGQYRDSLLSGYHHFSFGNSPDSLQSVKKFSNMSVYDSSVHRASMTKGITIVQEG